MPKRRLAVVLFTDIAGYTALMEQDEAAAMEIRNRHRTLLEKYHGQYHGEVISYAGDGSLSIFNTAREAVECAVQMQEAFMNEPQVPIRMGMHVGEIIMVQKDIAGDAVNVASRLESLAIPGSILISDKLYDDIKNQRDIQTAPMGRFEFKNVERPMEVFAIANKGLMVPEPASLTGKTREKKEGVGAMTFSLRQLWRRKVLHALIVYLLLAVALVKGADYIAAQYDFSPYWSDVMKVLLISMLPSVFFYCTFHKRFRRHGLQSLKKIALPSNLLLAMALILFLFQEKDLGAITKTVTTKDEFGNRVQKQIVKQQFKKKLNFYPMKNESQDSTLDWMGHGVVRMLSGDLDDDEYTWCNIFIGIEGLGSKMAHAQSQDIPMFISGSFRKNHADIEVTSELYNANSGRILKSRTVRGNDLFAIVDSLTVLLKTDLGIPDFHIRHGKDLPVKSLFTDNLEALQAWLEADFLKAEKLDPTFAINHYYKARVLHDRQLNAAESKRSIDQAMRHRERTSDLYNMRIRTLYYNIYDQPEKALALREMQAELHPEDPDAYNHLINEYTKNNQFDKALEAARSLYTLVPSLTHLEKAQAWSLRMLGRTDEALHQMSRYVKLFPKDILGWQLLADLQLNAGNLDQASDLFQKTSLMNPDDPAADLMLEHIEYRRESANSFDMESQQAFVFPYRYAGKETRGHRFIHNGQLFEKPDHRKAYQLYPINDSTLITIQGVKKTHFYDRSGKIYKYLEEHRGEAALAYRDDDMIKAADQLLRNGKYIEADQAYAKALEAYPDHEFLNDYRLHAQFMQTKIPPSFLRKWENAAGPYEQDHNLAYRDGKVYLGIYQLEWGWQWLPTSEHQFTTLEIWDTEGHFIEENGRVVALELRHANNEVRRFRKLE